MKSCKVLVEHGLDINATIECFENVLECAVEDGNLDWVRFCLESGANPNLEQGYNGHLIFANEATSASIELLIAWGAKMRGSSALTVASHSRRADLV